MDSKESTNFDQNSKKKIFLMQCGGYFSFFHTILTMIAVFLSFKCNGRFDVGAFIIAILFPEFYIVYKLAISYEICFPKGIKNLFLK